MVEAGMPDSRRIMDLVDVLEEEAGVSGGPGTFFKPDREPAAGPVKIHDLTEVVQDIPVRAVVDPALRELVLQRVTEIAERMAREMIPGIAERVIREEIEKLKTPPDAP